MTGIAAAVVALQLSLLMADPSPPAVTASAPKVEFTVKVTPDVVKLGDRATLDISARYPNSMRLFFPAAPKLEPFRMIEPPVVVEDRVEGDDTVRTWRAVITPLRVGPRKLPPFQVDYETSDGRTGRVDTRPLLVQVEPRIDLTSDQLPIAENDPPLPLFDRNWTLILLLIGLAIATVTAGITLVAVRYVAGLPRRGPPPPPPRPAHEVVAEKLQALERDQLLGRGELKEFTFRLSEILREYLGLRFHAETLELTTSELIDRMKRLSPKGLSLFELESFLQGTDLVKFAKLTPSHGEAQASLTTVERLVHTTRESEDEVRTARELFERKQLAEKPAHPFKRLFAVLVDLLLFSTVSAALIVGSRWLERPWLLWADLGLLALYVLLRDVYGPGSLGKVLTGLSLAPEDDLRPEHLSFGARVLRQLTLLVPVLGHTMEFVVMAYAADGRRVGDRWAGSRVLDKRPDASERTFLVYSLVALAVLAAATLLPLRWALS